jgi:hypothetical protein
MRFFPWLMDVVSRFFQNSRSLTTSLAIWNVARDPSHYAQLVLLLIGTLALGTASLGLSATRDKGAWSTARDETGGSPCGDQPRVVGCRLGALGRSARRFTGRRADARHRAIPAPPRSLTCTCSAR